jgi:CheY-like chemotaxis protein
MAMLNFLSSLQASYPNTPIQMITSLAEGADRIAARVARDAGCELLVSLPFSPEEYATDFPDTVSEFHELLDTVAESNRIVMPLAKNNTRENIRENGPNRDRQYAQVAAYLVSRSHIILALWDGDDSQAKVGGTAEVVDFMLRGIPEEYGNDESILPTDSGPVFHILTRRARNPDAVHNPGTGTWIYPEERSQKVYEQIFQQMESFNADPARGQTTGKSPPMK